MEKVEEKLETKPVGLCQATNFSELICSPQFSNLLAKFIYFLCACTTTFYLQTNKALYAAGLCS